MVVAKRFVTEEFGVAKDLNTATYPLHFEISPHEFYFLESFHLPPVPRGRLSPMLYFSHVIIIAEDRNFECMQYILQPKWGN